ncbi:MAG: toll/interleukin-1 receptor domain-containing protein [Prevotellaceae bacterium]|nr:toll/interleukin-1 receptor domain-containing protein [Candidatus Faecinaster equi]
MAKTKIFYQIVPLGTPYLVDNLALSLRGYPTIGFVDVEKVNRNNPVLYLYFGQSTADYTNSLRYPLLNWADNGKAMAVLKKAENFYDFIPEDLHKINAFFLQDEGDIETFKNVILTYFGFLETTRKIFLSYCRAEATGIANQLFDSLCRRKYRPFLDSYIIPYGVNFQEHLHHELADCEVMVLLNTPGFATRNWCMEEVEYAKKNNLGVVQVVFQGAKEIDTLPTCDVITYRVKAKKLSKLNKLKLNEIIELVERMRAKSYQYRQQALCNKIGFACDGDELLHKDYGIVVNNSSSQIYYPSVCIPSSQFVEIASNRMSSIANTTGYSQRVLFDANSCRPDVASHFTWLNNQLNVKTLDINKNIKL